MLLMFTPASDVKGGQSFVLLVSVALKALGLDETLTHAVEELIGLVIVAPIETLIVGQVVAQQSNSLDPLIKQYVHVFRRRRKTHSLINSIPRKQEALKLTNSGVLYAVGPVNHIDGKQISHLIKLVPSLIQGIVVVDHLQQLAATDE